MTSGYESYGGAGTPQSWPKLWVAVLLIIGYFVMQGIALFALAPEIFFGAAQKGISPGARVSVDPIVAIWSVLLSSIPMIGLVLVLAMRAPWWPRFGLGIWSALSFKRTAIVAIATVGCATLFNIAYGTLVMDALGPDFKFQTDVTEMLNAIPKTGVNMVLLYLAVAVIAPAVEELLFRGFLQNAFRKWFGPITSIMLAAMLFAAVHLQFYEFPVLVSLGAAFGYVYYKTGSMRVAILLHMANNALTLALM